MKRESVLVSIYPYTSAECCCFFFKYYPTLLVHVFFSIHLLLFLRQPLACWLEIVLSEFSFSSVEIVIFFVLDGFVSLPASIKLI